MAVQILSDLHLESPPAYDVFEIVPKAPYLALLGDIGNIAAHKDGCLAFLTRQLRQFKAVLFVPGNHEAYRSNWDDTLEILRIFQQHAHHDASVGEFVLLDRTTYRLPGTNVVVLGCSLFSRIPPDKHMTIGMSLNDFHQTSGWTTDNHNDMHQRDLAWLNAEVSDLEESDISIMIFSHWSPSTDRRAIEPRHAGSSIGSAFSTDLSEQPCFRSGKVKVWAFGHTHYNCDFECDRAGDAGPLRLVTNQRGYAYCNADGFDPDKTLSI
ncbi:hypothetical protein QQS21_005377 [Conoideocrella luteorostrata]|uniref:Calcineurin-like phosphoesterase domain-containing protein n=1 Tax=Conoideocrella luteorostrata TaxID=1105319 RepID=A0AAJ0CSD2_9HYPO|nr:hypothetical protein QQS21_005377 [Conoideocrella luteorostrata]